MDKLIKNILGGTLLLMSVMLLTNALSCKNPKGAGGGSKDFEIEKITLYGKNALKVKKISLTGAETPKQLVAKVKNCQNFTMKWEIGEKSGEAQAADSIATADVAVPKTRSILKITLMGSGMNTWEKSVEIVVNPKRAQVSFFIKRAESEQPIKIENDGKLDTKADTAKLTIDSKEDMKAVTIQGNPVELGSNKKKLETDVTAGSTPVNVKVEYENYREEEITFTLVKRSASENVGLQLTKATIYSGNVLLQKQVGGESIANVLSFDKDGKAEVELDNIEYSVVKLSMHFDAQLKTANITKCYDARKPDHADAPASLLNYNVFSGRIDERRGGNDKIKSEPIKGNTYLELLVVGAGGAAYDIEATAEGREPFKCSILIVNKNTMIPPVQPDKEVDDSNFYANLYLEQLFLATGEQPFTWLGHIEQPLITKDDQGQKLLQARQNPEYMGDEVKYIFGFNKEKVKGDMLLFCYNVTDDPMNEACHNFVAVYGTTLDRAGVRAVFPKFNPEEKFVDAFVATKETLPYGMYPWSLKNKWKKIVKKGFLVTLLKDKKVKGDVSAKALFRNVYDYRTQSKTAEKGTRLQIAKNMTYKSFINGDAKEAYSDILSGSKDKDEDRDIFALMPTFEDLTSITSLKYDIKQVKGKGSAKKSHTYKGMPDKSEVFIIGGDDNSKYYYDKTQDKYVFEGGYKNVFAFEKGVAKNENVYEIDVTVTLKDGSTETFKYEINYREACTLESMSCDEGSTMGDASALFGVPTYYPPASQLKLNSVLKEFESGSATYPAMSVDLF